MFKTVE